MKLQRYALIALTALVPSMAAAHSGDRMPDPPLHVDPKLKDCSVEFSSDLTQDAFHRFVREFGSTAAFKHMAAPTMLGRRGVEVAIQQMNFHVEDHSDAWNDTFAHPNATHELGSDLSFPKITLRVGVTDRLDVGAFWTKNLNANYGWLGLEAKYGLLAQNERTPIILSGRVAYTKTLYVSDMDMHAVTTDVSAGRTFWNVLTPYAGVGADLVIARETSDVVALHAETQVVPHAIGGAELKFWHLALGVEGELSALNRFEFKVAGVF